MNQTIEKLNQCASILAETNLSTFDAWLDQAHYKLSLGSSADITTLSGSQCASYSHGFMTFLIVIGAFLIIFGFLLMCGVIGSHLSDSHGKIIRDNIHQVYQVSQNGHAQPLEAPLSENTKNAHLAWPSIYWMIAGSLLIVAAQSGQELINLIKC